MKSLIKQLWLVLSLVGLAGAINAQDDSAVNTPWTVGLEVSKALHLRIDKDVPVDRNFTNQIIGAKVGYRLERWIGLWGRLRNHDINAHLSQALVWENNDLVGGTASRYYEFNIVEALVGMELMWRFWQGDFGLSIGMGPSRRQGQVNALDQEGRQYRANVDPITEVRAFGQIDYTYWPTEKFGIRAGLNYSKPWEYNFGSSNRNVPFTAVSKPTVGMFSRPLIEEGLIPDYYEYTQSLQISIGVDYRF